MTNWVLAGLLNRYKSILNSGDKFFWSAHREGPRINLTTIFADSFGEFFITSASYISLQISLSPLLGCAFESWWVCWQSHSHSELLLAPRMDNVTRGTLSFDGSGDISFEDEFLAFNRTTPEVEESLPDEELFPVFTQATEEWTSVWHVHPTARDGWPDLDHSWQVL